MAKRILRINMTDLQASYETVPEKWLRWAGKALTSSIVCDEVDATCHPLGPNNKVALPLAGSLAPQPPPSSGRTSFGGKSPLTGGIKESNAGGLCGQMIARLGLAAIIIEGTPPKGKWYTLVVNNDGVRFESAANLVGKGMYEVDKILWQSYPKSAVIGIGQVWQMW